MKKRVCHSYCLAAVVAGAFMGGVANADVRYTESVKTDMGKGSSDGGAVTTSTTWIADGLQRVENTAQYGPIKTSDITITSCDKGQVYKVDHDLKIYTATSTASKPGSDAPATKAAKPASKPAGKKTGKITSHVAVKYHGEETVAGRKCRHYTVETTMKMEGCAGNSEMKMKTEVWVTDYKMPVFDCGDRTGQGMGYGSGGSDCDITFVQTGDTKLMADAYRGLAMRTKTYMPDGRGGNMVTTREITSLSEAKLPESTFVIPADYKLVSDDEFQKQRSAAMLRGMMSGAGSPGTQNPDASADDDGGDGEERAEEQREEKPEGRQKEETKKPKRPKFRLPF